MLRSPPSVLLAAGAVVGAAAAAVVGLGAAAAVVGAAAAGAVVGLGAAAGAVVGVGAGAAAGLLHAALSPSPNTPTPRTRKIQRRVTVVGCTGSFTGSTSEAPFVKRYLIAPPVMPSTK